MNNERRKRFFARDNIQGFVILETSIFVRKLLEDFEVNNEKGMFSLPCQLSTLK